MLREKNLQLICSTAYNCQPRVKYTYISLQLSCKTQFWIEAANKHAASAFEDLSQLLLSNWTAAKYLWGYQFNDSKNIFAVTYGWPLSCIQKPPGYLKKENRTELKILLFQAMFPVMIYLTTCKEGELLRQMLIQLI